MLLTDVMLVKRLEYREIPEGSSTDALKITELLSKGGFHGSICTELARLKAAKQRLQHSPFAGSDGAVID